MNNRYKRGIIFDMDNTILQSRINFPAMKKAIYDLLSKYQLCDPEIDLQNHTASQLIEMGRQSANITEEIEKKVWDTVTAFEKEGMHEAVLEAHVPEVLTYLRQRAHLFILTNNAFSAACEALGKTGIAGYFDGIVAREQMTALKPSPSGIFYILNQFPDLSASHWTMVGDSWIDGKAAQDSMVPFIAYKANPQHMERHSITPHAYITDIRELLVLDLNS